MACAQYAMKLLRNVILESVELELSATSFGTKLQQRKTKQGANGSLLVSQSRVFQVQARRRRATALIMARPASSIAYVSGSGIGAACRKPRISPPGNTSV